MMKASSYISKGLGYMLLSAFFFSLMNVCVKLAGVRLSSHQIVLVRSVLTLLFTFYLLRRKKIYPWGSDKLWLFLRGFSGFLALVCIYYAITQIPLADAVLMQQMSPIFTVILAAIFLKEHLRGIDYLGSLMSLVGVILIAEPSFLFGNNARLPLFPVLLGLMAAVLSGVAYTIVRKLRSTEHELVVVFYFPLVSLPGAIPLAIPSWMMPVGWEWIWLLGVGITGQIAQIFLTKGIHLEPAGRAAAIGYVQFLFALIWGILWFHEYPTMTSLIGAGLVILGTIAIIQTRQK